MFIIGLLHISNVLLFRGLSVNEDYAWTQDWFMYKTQNNNWMAHKFDGANLNLEI